jgi:hypothetical protein
MAERALNPASSVRLDGSASFRFQWNPNARTPSGETMRFRMRSSHSLTAARRFLFLPNRSIEIVETPPSLPTSITEFHSGNHAGVAHSRSQENLTRRIAIVAAVASSLKGIKRESVVTGYCVQWFDTTTSTRIGISRT